MTRMYQKRTDAYLTASKDGANLTLVTFDEALAGKAKEAELLARSRLIIRS